MDNQQSRSIIPIGKWVSKVPGGTFIIPLLLGSLVNTIGQSGIVGDFSLTFFSSSDQSTVFLILMFCAGAGVNFRQAPKILGQSFVLLFFKVMAGALFSILVGYIFGPAGFLGISTLAIIGAMTNSNGGIYYGLVSTYGDSDDLLTYALLTINDGPYFTLIALGASGLASIPIKATILSMFPFLVGMILGNLDERVSKFFSPMVGQILPFLGFCLGCGINLSTILTSGLSGVLLGLINIAVTGLVLIPVDRFILKGRGYRGAAICTVAGNAAATPALVAAVDASMAPYVDSAVGVISGAIITCTLLTPFFTRWVANKWGCPALDRQREAEALAEKAESAESPA
ncbi:MAG: 2-keto-3-deoxygluconate permease [Lachnospiraceae bacterium]|nr:2-keto-3-deoxygluconate permease [Lachnospiraceae bacterium]